MVYTLRFFFSLKCSLFHNSNLFGSCIIHILYTECAKIKKKKFRRQKVNDGDTFWEMRRLAISSLCERHTVYSHKPRVYSIAYYPLRLYGIAYSS